MGMLTRLINVIRSNLNDLLNRAEDPAKLLEQTLVDMETAYRKAKDQVARAIADQKRMEKAAAAQADEMRKWEQRAVAAVQQGDDALAREALGRKQEHQRMQQQYAQELVAHRENVALLKTGLHDLGEKIEEIRRKKQLLISRQRRTEAQDAIHQTLEGVRSAGALETIERMEHKIDEMAALSAARRELSAEVQGDALERRFQALGPSDEVEAELLELKARAQLEDQSGT